MTDNFLRHKILQDIFQYKSMFYFKKDIFISFDNFIEFFPKTKNFDRAFINLLSKGYITEKNENGVRKINIERDGLFALSEQRFIKENRRLIWEGIRNYGMLVANIAVAVVAIIALTRDTSKFAEKSELKELRDKLIQLQEKVLLKPDQHNQVVKNATLLCDSLPLSLPKYKPDSAKHK